MLLALVDCIVYSSNWIIGAVLATTGILIWDTSFITSYFDVVNNEELVIPLVNFTVGIWVVPFLLYWSEKKARHNAFLQWTSLKVGFSLLFGYM